MIVLFVMALAIAAGSGRSAVGVSADLGTSGTPALKLLLTTDALSEVPDGLFLGGSAINNAGDWVTAAGSGSSLILRRAGETTLTRILQSGDPVPGVPLSAVDTVRSVRINDAGTVCALMDFNAAVTQRAIVTYDGSNLRKIAASSDSPPGSPESVFGRLIGLIGLNNTGDVAFAAPMVPLGWPYTEPTHTTLFITPAGGDPIRLVGPGDDAPDTDGGTLDQISSAQLNDQGEVLFRAAIVGGSGGFGYFVARRDSGGTITVRKVVRSFESDLQGGVFNGSLPTNGVQLNNAGQVAMLIGGRGLYISSPGAGLSLIIPLFGDLPGPLSGMKVQDFYTLGASFNDSGSVAVAVHADGLYRGSPNAILRYTPETGLEVLAYAGQPAPGLDDQWFWNLQNVVMNGSGDVSFFAGFEPPGAGLFRAPIGGVVSPVVIRGQEAPAPGDGPFSYLSEPRILDNGSVYFESALGDYGYAAFLADTSAPSTFSVVANGGEPLPPGSRVVSRTLFMGGAGTHAMFEARRTGSGLTYWTHDAVSGATRRVVGQADLAPSSVGGRLQGIGPSYHNGLNDAGEVVFAGSVFGRSGTFLFSWNPAGGMTKLVGPGDALPGTTSRFTSCWFASLLAPQFAGQLVVFRGNLNNGTTGIFVVPRGGGTVEKIALNTDPAPGGGTFTDSSGSRTLNYPRINNAGQVAFWAPVSAGGYGIFIREPDSSFVKVAATGDPAPGGGTFSAFTLPAPADFNDLGQVVFFASVSGGPGGLFVGTAGGPVQALALSGEAAPGDRVYAFAAETKDAVTNGRGDVLFKAPLEGGQFDSGLFLRRADSGVVEAVAVKGDAAPGRSFPFSEFEVTLNNLPGESLVLGPTGEVLFGNAVDADDRQLWGLFRYNGPGTLETIFLRGDRIPDSGEGTVAYASQQPGSGVEGLYFLAVRTLVSDSEARDAVYMLDTLPPTVAVAAADPSTLWPPNGAMRPVTVSGLAADTGSGVAGTEGTFEVTDEYGLVEPTGTFTIGASGEFSFLVPLEARRRGTDRDGRRYTIRVTVRDACGNSAAAMTQVVVPFAPGK